MNNAIFVNHIALMFSDRTILKYPSSEYREYFNLYNRFLYPPGIEYIVSRNMHYDIKNPWNCQPTQYPMPVAKQISFADAADSFGQDISNEIDNGKTIYLLWSGGLDSTSVAVSVLKNIKPYQREKLIIVCSDVSRKENPMFYHNFVRHYTQMDFDNFNPANIDLYNSLILDGEGGDQTFGSSAANKFLSIYPEKIYEPWEKNIDFIRNNWKLRSETDESWDLFMNMLKTTITKGTARVETVHDFFWWVNFNFKIDGVMFRTSLGLGEDVADEDFEYYAKHTLRRMFVSEKMQQWSMTAGAEGKIGNARKTVKLGARQYIYEFDRNEYYYREKRKEFSLRLDYASSKYFAIDKDYRRYSFEERAVRQQIRNMFYPNRDGRIKFYVQPKELKNIFDMWYTERS